VTIRVMQRDFHIDKLSDHFGQYSLLIVCEFCGHKRAAEPHTLGKLCGWDTRLDDVAKRMRCSKCGKKQCTVQATPLTKPRGYSALPR
jgi:DNA-directed RNA polymerase subunit RPC12/RpoP